MKIPTRLVVNCKGGESIIKVSIVPIAWDDTGDDVENGENGEIEEITEEVERPCVGDVRQAGVEEKVHGEKYKEINEVLNTKAKHDPRGEVSEESKKLENDRRGENKYNTVENGVVCDTKVDKIREGQNSGGGCRSKKSEGHNEMGLIVAEDKSMNGPNNLDSKVEEKNCDINIEKGGKNGLDELDQNMSESSIWEKQMQLTNFNLVMVPISADNGRFGPYMDNEKGMGAIEVTPIRIVRPRKQISNSWKRNRGLKFKKDRISMADFLVKPVQRFTKSRLTRRKLFSAGKGKKGGVIIKEMSDEELASEMGVGDEINEELENQRSEIEREASDEANATVETRKRLELQLYAQDQFLRKLFKEKELEGVQI